MTADQLTIPLSIFVSVVFATLSLSWSLMKSLRQIEERLGIRIGKVQAEVTALRLDIGNLATRDDVDRLGMLIDAADTRLTVIETTNEVLQAVGGE